MEEYWWAARQAAATIRPELMSSLPGAVPAVFRALRPWVHHGWEMVLLALAHDAVDVEAWMADYVTQQRLAVQRCGIAPEQCQQALDGVRQGALETARSEWLALHQPFPGVVERLRRFGDEGVDWAVLTTKGASFTAELLDGLGLSPWRLYGREDGAKPDVLLRLLQERPVHAFVEDRRATLETVRATPGLESLRCLLVGWGYLKPEDLVDLPDGVRALTPEGLERPLAQWP